MADVKHDRDKQGQEPTTVIEDLQPDGRVEKDITSALA